MERLNIHGLEGCNTPTGKRCTACCSEKAEIKGWKPLGVRCPLLENGCTVHKTEQQPQVCKEYHCSQDVEMISNQLILHDGLRRYSFHRATTYLEKSLADGETEKQYLEASKEWLTGRLHDKNTPPPDYNNG